MNTNARSTQIRSFLRRSLIIFGSVVLLHGTVSAQNAPRVKLSTSMGDIVLELAPDKAPKTVENFLLYVNDKFFDGTVFHRVIDGFMIQGGGFTTDMQQNRPEPPSCWKPTTA